MSLVCVSVCRPLFLPLSVCVREKKRGKDRAGERERACVEEGDVSVGACGVRLMCTASVAVSAESGHTPLPNDATSILEHRLLSTGVCVRVYVCVLPQGNYPGGYNEAPYTGSDHSLFVAFCVSQCVCVCVCVCVNV